MKKLELKKGTVTRLNNEKLREVIGGGGNPYETLNCPIEIPKTIGCTDQNCSVTCQIYTTACDSITGILTKLGLC